MSSEGTKASFTGKGRQKLSREEERTESRRGKRLNKGKSSHHKCAPSGRTRKEIRRNVGTISRKKVVDAFRRGVYGGEPKKGGRGGVRS